MDLVTAIAGFCVAIAAIFLGLWNYYDRRDYALFEHARRKSTFCCVRCHYLYAATGRPETCKCPKCSHDNARLRF